MAEEMKKELRKAYCEKLIELAEKDPKVVVLEADLMSASGTKAFKEKFPERAVNVGIAEANLVGVASGLSLQGFIPFAATFGPFAARRAFDQFFLSANYAKLNVKLVGTDPGVSAAFNGGTHMPFEDVGLMRQIPNLVIAEPSDPVSAAEFTQLLYEHKGCAYMRLHRKDMPFIYKQGEKFELGKAKVHKQGKDVTLIGLGAVMMQEVFKAAKILEEKGLSVSVVDALSIKPYDMDMVRDQAARTGKLVVCENCNVLGGLGAAIAQQIVAEGLNCKLANVAVMDRFGQVGTQDWLVKEFNLSADDIVKKAETLLK